MALLSNYPSEALRRLPIIYIEDVCFMDSLHIVVWLMICEKEHVITSWDVYLLICSVISLCETDNIYDNGNHEEDQNDCVLVLKIRALYGGMKGDIEMLKNVKCNKIIATNYPKKIEYSHHIEILDEAIDFHPFPGLLNYISKNSGVELGLIKRMIWIAESGVNLRKKESIEESDKIQNTNEWFIIKKWLTRYRGRV